MNASNNDYLAQRFGHWRVGKRRGMLCRGVIGHAYLPFVRPLVGQQTSPISVKFDCQPVISIRAASISINMVQDM